MSDAKIYLEDHEKEITAFLNKNVRVLCTSSVTFFGPDSLLQMAALARSFGGGRYDMEIMVTKSFHNGFSGSWVQAGHRRSLSPLQMVQALLAYEQEIHDVAATAEGEVVWNGDNKPHVVKPLQELGLLPEEAFGERGLAQLALRKFAIPDWETFPLGKTSVPLVSRAAPEVPAAGSFVERFRRSRFGQALGF